MPAALRTAAARALAPAALLALGLAMTRQDEPWPLEEPAPVADGVPAQLEGWDRSSCAGCHEAIAAEWSSTRHALAWTDPHYVDALKKIRRKQSCHGCHAPEPLHQTGLERRPKPREALRHHGVDCRACHAGPDGTILGPWGAETEAHVSVRGESFAAEGVDRLCSACHDTTIGPVIGIAKDFDRARSDGLGCVDCHMAPVERSAAVDPESGEPSPVRPGRSHALQTPRDPAFLARAFALSVEAEGPLVRLRVENRAGHQVPGLDGRRFVLEARLLDAAGAERARGALELDHRAHLPAGGRRELSLELLRPPAPGARLEVRARHFAPGLPAEGVLFLERTLALP